MGNSNPIYTGENRLGMNIGKESTFYPVASPSFQTTGQRVDVVLKLKKLARQGKTKSRQGKIDL